MKPIIVGEVVRQGNVRAVRLDASLIPVPESLEDAPDGALILVTPCGKLKCIMDRDLE